LHSDPERLTRKSLFAAVSGDQAVGSVALSKFLPSFWKKNLWRDPGAIAVGVFDLVVHPDHQAKGVGRFLMLEVEHLAPSYGCSTVRLDAFAENPLSLGFYRHIGYDDRGVIDLRGCSLRLFERVLLNSDP
jgi:GNAT superfamily N-acetyltransferase